MGPVSSWLEWNPSLVWFCSLLLFSFSFPPPLLPCLGMDSLFYFPIIYLFFFLEMTEYVYFQLQIHSACPVILWLQTVGI